MEALSLLHKCLEEKANIQTRLRATNSGEDDDSYQMDIMTFKLSTNSSSDNIIVIIEKLFIKY